MSPSPTIERLQDAIWGDEQPNAARRTVQVYVSNLRQILGDGSLIARGAPASAPGRIAPDDWAWLDG
jgi:DNA-binding SARP family transcriptional activator